MTAQDIYTPHLATCMHASSHQIVSEALAVHVLHMLLLAADSSADEWRRSAESYRIHFLQLIIKARHGCKHSLHC